MPRNRVKRNPKPTREQLLKVVKLQQQQVWLLFQHLEVLYKEIDDQERDIMSVLKVLEQKQNNDLVEFLKVEIKGLEEELECPVCLEVAAKAPIYKCSDDHLICRWAVHNFFQEISMTLWCPLHCPGSAVLSSKTVLNAEQSFRAYIRDAFKNVLAEFVR